MKKISIIIFTAVTTFSMQLFAQNKANNNMNKPVVHDKQTSSTKMPTSGHILLDAVYYWSWDAASLEWNTPDSSREIDFVYDATYNNAGYKTCNDTAIKDSGLYTKTYNANKNNTTTLYQTKTSAQTYWINNTLDTSIYDGNNNLTSDLFQTWNGSNWEGFYKFTYLYDSNNNLINEVYQSRLGTSLAPDSLNTFIYDANNNMIRYIYQSWSGSNWVNKLKDTLTYNANNNLTSQTFQTLGGSAWIDSLLILKTYDVNNNLTTSLSQKWNGSTWINSELHNYTYDANNNQTSSLYQKWNFTSWLNSSENIYTYDANNNLTGNLYQTWNMTVWVNNYKYIYTFDLNNNLTDKLFQKWNGTALVNNNLKAWTYDANHLMLSSTNKNFNSTGSKVISGDSIYYYYHFTSGVNNISDQKGSILLFPNPSNGKFCIQIEAGKSSIGGDKLAICNILGEQIYSQYINYNSTVIIDLSSQPSGVYFYKLINEAEGLAGTGKLIIQK